MSTTTSGTALAERPTESVRQATIPNPRQVTGGAMPAVRAAAYLHPIARPAEGVLPGLPGAVTDLSVSRNGRYLVAAHYGEDAVSVIDTATLAVTATVSGIAEPCAVATAADRAYLRSASILEDGVVAVDLESGTALAAREVGVGAGGLAVSPAGDVLYVARSADGIADIAVIEVESGTVTAIPVTRAAGVSIDDVRINAAGTRLYGALTTAAGGALVVVDLRTGRVQTVAVGDTVGEIAVHGDGRRVFVTGWNGGVGAVLHVIDTGSGRVLHTAAIEGLPIGVLAGGAVLYIAQGDHVAIHDATTLQAVGRAEIGRPVSSLAVSRDGSRLYVGDYDGAISALAVQAVGQVLPASS